MLQVGGVRVVPVAERDRRAAHAQHAGLADVRLGAVGAQHGDFGDEHLLAEASRAGRGVGGGDAAQRGPAELGGAQAVAEDRTRHLHAVGIALPSLISGRMWASWAESPRFIHSSTEVKSVGSRSIVARSAKVWLKASTLVGR